MLVGLREREQGISNYLLALPAKTKGLALVELIIVTIILSVILASLFITLNIGQFSYPLSSTKLELQSEARLAMNWIMKDLRQVISWNIASVANNPSTSHLKFNLWTWNTATNTWDLSADYIEYDYDSNLKKLSRKVNVGGNVTTIEFNNIIEPPFYTSYVGMGDPNNTLDTNDLLNNKKLIIVLSAQKPVRGSLYLTFTLKSEIRIRNG